MRLVRALITNDPLANIAFVVVILMGLLAYGQMPREQDPEINFNWLNISTALPGASAEDVEKRVTQPLEDAIKGVADIKFVASNSREGIASMLIRFGDISERVFDKRVNDLRREIQNRASIELPPESKEPRILEVTTSNGFPTAMVLVTGAADDEYLRLAAKNLRDDIERMAGVDRVYANGLNDPELRVEFMPAAATFISKAMALSRVCSTVVMMRLPPGLPVASQGLPSRKTMVGLMEDRGRLPPSIRLRSPCISPNRLGLPGNAAKSPISLFSNMPVPGTAILEPKLAFRV